MQDKLHLEARGAAKDRDGTFQGQRYFTCDKGAGLFVTLCQINFPTAEAQQEVLKPSAANGKRSEQSRAPLQAAGDPQSTHLNNTVREPELKSTTFKSRPGANIIITHTQAPEISEVQLKENLDVIDQCSPTPQRENGLDKNKGKLKETHDMVVHHSPHVHEAVISQDNVDSNDVPPTCSQSKLSTNLVEADHSLSTKDSDSDSEMLLQMYGWTANQNFSHSEQNNMRNMPALESTVEPVKPCPPKRQPEYVNCPFEAKSTTHPHDSIAHPPSKFPLGHHVSNNPAAAHDLKVGSFIELPVVDGTSKYSGIIRWMGHVPQVVAGIELVNSYLNSYT